MNHKHRYVHDFVATCEFSPLYQIDIYHIPLDVECCICPYLEFTSPCCNVILTSQHLHQSLHLNLNLHNIYAYTYDYASLFLQPISRNIQCLGPTSQVTNSNMTSLPYFLVTPLNCYVVPYCYPFVLDLQLCRIIFNLTPHRRKKKRRCLLVM